MKESPYGFLLAWEEWSNWNGWLDCSATWMDGAKGCGSGAASLARPGCGFAKADAFPKRGHKVGQPAALPIANLRRLRRHRRPGPERKAL